MESSSFEHHPFVRPKRPRSTFLSNFEQRTTELVRCQLFRTSITRTGPDGARYHGCVITLGVDPGTAICGFGVVDFDGGSLRLVEAGCIRTDATETDAARLEQLHAALAGLLAQHRPDRIGIERLFFQRNVQTAMAVGQARGVALLAAAEAGVPIDEPTPNEVKQAVCGNGAADKGQVATMVGRLLGVTLSAAPDDATDALAIAIGCAYRAAAAPRVAPSVAPGAGSR